MPILDAAIADFNENQRRRSTSSSRAPRCSAADCTVKEGEITKAEVDPLLQASDLRISRNEVKVNGLEFQPEGGATIAVFPQIGRVVSSNAVVKFGDATVPIRARSTSTSTGGGTDQRQLLGAGGRITIVSFKPNIPFTDFAGFGLDGEVKLDLVDGGVSKYSEASFRLGAAERLRRVRRASRRARAATVQADNPTGPELEDIDVQRSPRPNLGGAEAHDMRFHYLRRGADGCPAKFWKATANIFLGVEDGSAGFRLAPPPPQNGVASARASSRAPAASSCSAARSRGRRSSRASS